MDRHWLPGLVEWLQTRRDLSISARQTTLGYDHGEGFDMNRIAQELDEKLRTLNPPRARYLESLVREALGRAEQADLGDSSFSWPVGYFDQTAGALSGENFERPPQGELPRRDDW